MSINDFARKSNVNFSDLVSEKVLERLTWIDNILLLTEENWDEIITTLDVTP